MKYGKQPVVIIGAPQSGINMLKDCLQNLGYAVPGYSVSPSDGQPGGVDRVMDINRELFAALKVNDPLTGSLPLRWLQTSAGREAREKIIDLLETAAGSAVGPGLLLGDPLLCRVARIWFDCFREKGLDPKVIHLLRHPGEVARSLREAEGVSLRQAYRCWLDCCRVAALYSRNRRFALLSFSLLWADPAAALIKLRSELNLVYNCDLARFRPRFLDELVLSGRRKHFALYLPPVEKKSFAPYFRLYYHISRKPSNLVWLSSYPRSGNTLLRIILNHNFGIKTFSHYNDNNDIGSLPEVAQIVGHENRDWSFQGKYAFQMKPQDYIRLDSLRYDGDKPLFVKTHSHRHEGFDPDRAIYIYRDGRAALRSYASYLVKFRGEEVNEDKLIEKMLTVDNVDGDLISPWSRHVGPWNRHVQSWKEHTSGQSLALRFEDMVRDLPQAVDTVAEFLQVVPYRRDVPGFNLLHAVNRDFFRRGEKKSWPDLFDLGRHALFWIINYEEMTQAGYENEKSPVCAMLPGAGSPAIPGKEDPAASFNYLEEMDGILENCAQIVLQHLGSFDRHRWGEAGRKLKRAYEAFLAYYDRYGSPQKKYSWKKTWHTMFSPPH